MSDLLSSLFKKERPWANRSCCSRFLLKKEPRQWFACDSSVSLSKNERFSRKKMHFSYVFDSFPPRLCQKSESLPSLFAKSLFFKDRRDQFGLVLLWANRSCFSLRKSDRERIPFLPSNQYAACQYSSRPQSETKFDVCHEPHRQCGLSDMVLINSFIHVNAQSYLNGFILLHINPWF